MKKNTVFVSGGVLIAAVMAGNILNFLFNAILGRALTLEQFSLLTLMSTLWLQISVLLNALSSTANNRVAYLAARNNSKVAKGFKTYLTNKSLKFSIGLIIAWILLIPVLSFIFHTQDYLLFLSISPAIIFGIYTAINRGFFQETLSFVKAAIILLSEAVSKLLFAIIFLVFHLKSYVFLSVPLSVFCAFAITLLFVYFQKQEKTVFYKNRFPGRLLFATFLTLFSSAAFLSIDLLLARIFLDSRNSGAYALLSLVGKMVFFFGSILNMFILTIASRDTGLKRNSELNFYKILFAMTFLLFVACMGLGILGNEIVPFLFGEKTRVILPYLILYTLGISFFTIATAFSTYHLAKQEFIFAYNGLFSTFLFIVGILFWHSNVFSFVTVIVVTSAIYLLINVVMHLSTRNILYDPDRDVVKEMKKYVRRIKKPLSVSICIPAYNEGENIRYLLKQLLTQKEYGFKIEEIVVASDGSTDNTVQIINSFKKKGVKVINGKNNRGQTYRQNEIIERTDTDILVLLNADLLLGDNEIIARLVFPIMKGADLSAQWGRPATPRTFLEKILHAGFEFKYYIYKHHKKGNNIYTCVGHMRALSKRFYTKVVFPPESEGEDQYLYLLCIKKRYKYEYSPSVNSYFKLPESFQDYKKYARRIFQTQVKYADTFSEQLTRRERKLPIVIQLRGLLYGVSKHPLFTPLYIFLHVATQQWALRQPISNTREFEISKSTKSFYRADTTR